VQLTIAIRLTSTAEGGRRSAISPGYRSCWGNGDTVDGAEQFHDAPILILDPNTVAPGDSGVAVIQPILPDAIGWEDVRVGDVMTMVEGSRVCGTATVTAIDRESYDRLWSVHFSA
jgi:hypothetical protein